MTLFQLPPYHMKVVMSAAQVGQAIDWGITYLKALEIHKTTKGAGINVAVLDTGIDMSHPDFQGAIVAAQDFTGSVHGVMDANGHGTHTAGTIGARDNGVGSVGMAPECGLIICKVLGDDGAGDDEMIAAGIRWAVTMGAQILSMSFESPSPSPVIRAAIDDAVQKGRLVVCAAGNRGIAGNGYPAAWDDVCQSIAANDQKGRIADFSGVGPQVDVCAPGVHILSCWPGGSYAYLDGTSMACPHVSGGLALVAAYRRAKALPQIASQAELNNALHATAIALEPTPPPNQRWGYGVFNPTALLDYATAPPNAPPAAAPRKARRWAIPFLYGYQDCEWAITANPIVKPAAPAA